MSQTTKWFAVRQVLSNRQATTLTACSFLLPIVLWSLVSYVPFLWHPKVEIVEPGSVSWFKSGMLVDRAVFSEQQQLAERGYDVGDADGKLGPKTEAAIRAFQRDQHIQVDGVVGPQTLGALGQASSTSSVEPQQQTQQRRDSVRTTGADPTVAAPRADAPPPDGSTRASELGQQDQTRRNQQAADASRVTGHVPVNDHYKIAPTPDDIHILVAGGPGKHSAWIPSFGGTAVPSVRIAGG